MHAETKYVLQALHGWLAEAQTLLSAMTNFRFQKGSRLFSDQSCRSRPQVFPKLLGGIVVPKMTPQ